MLSTIKNICFMLLRWPLACSTLGVQNFAYAERILEQHILEKIYKQKNIQILKKKDFSTLLSNFCAKAFLR